MKMRRWLPDCVGLAFAFCLVAALGCSSSHDEGYEAREAIGEGNLLLWRASGGHMIAPENVKNPPEADAELHEEAMAEFDRAIELDPENSEAYFARALGQLYVDKYAAAIDDLTEAIRLDERNAEAWYYRSLAYGASDDPEQAKQDLEQALLLEPTIAGTPAEGEAAAAPAAAAS